MDLRTLAAVHTLQRIVAGVKPYAAATRAIADLAELQPEAADLHPVDVLGRLWLDPRVRQRLELGAWLWTQRGACPRALDLKRVGWRLADVEWVESDRRGEQLGTREDRQAEVEDLIFAWWHETPASAREAA